MTHKCSLCGLEFETEEEYLNHVCEKTGFKPNQIEHQGPEFEAISKEALKRGEERKEKEEK